MKYDELICIERFRKQLESINLVNSTEFTFFHHFKETTCLVKDNSSFFVAKFDVSADRARNIEWCLKLVANDATLSRLAPRLIYKYDNIASGSALLFNFIPGISLQSHQARDLLRDLHCLSIYIEDINLDAYGGVTNIVNGFISEILLMVSSDRILNKFVDRLSLGPPDQVVCCVHGDFTWQNFILPTDTDLMPLSIIDWEQSGLGYKGFDFGWLLSSGQHTGLLSFSDFPPLNENLKFFIVLGYLRMIYRLRKVRHKTEVHLMHEVKCLLDLRDFSLFFDLAESRQNLF